MLKEAQSNTSWLESLSRGTAGGEGMRGYAPLISEYIYYLTAKLAFHRQHPEFNGTFEYEEYISLKSINDPNEGYETISDLMTLQDQIDAFQKLVFSHFRSGANNECRIAALVPLVQESYGIYKFITSMLRAMHTSRCTYQVSVRKANRGSARRRRGSFAPARPIRRAALPPRQVLLRMLEPAVPHELDHSAETTTRTTEPPRRRRECAGSPRTASQ